MKNLISYAPAFVAVGCKLNFGTEGVELDIVEVPKDKKIRSVVEQACSDIVLFDETSNFQDGVSAVYLTDFVDGEPNPFPQTKRLNVLNRLGIMQGEKFVLPVLNSAKVNRSWHLSEKPGECTYFKEVCTHRGLIDNPHRRGRKTDRKPNEYHLRTSKGISREQLVTPNLQALYDIIPNAVTTSGKSETTTIFSEEELRQIPKEQLLKFMERIQSVMDGK